MANITSINRQTLGILEPAILAKLNETLGKEFGLHFAFKGGNFSEMSAVLKLEIAAKAADGTVIDRGREEYTKHASLYGLKPEWLGTTYRDYSGREFRIVGLNPNKRKNVVEIVDVRTGKKYIQAARAVAGYKGGVKQASPRVVIGSANSDHAEIVRQIEIFRSECPEGYYADGEHRAAGLSEKQIYNMHYERIAVQIAAERNHTKRDFAEDARR